MVKPRPLMGFRGTFLVLLAAVFFYGSPASAAVFKCGKLLLAPYIRKNLDAWANEIPKLGPATFDSLTAEQREFAQAQADLAPYFRSGNFTKSLARALKRVQRQDADVGAREFLKSLAEMPATQWTEVVVSALVAETKPSDITNYEKYSQKKWAPFVHSLRVYLHTHDTALLARLYYSRLESLVRRSAPEENVSSSREFQIDLDIPECFYLEFEHFDFFQVYRNSSPSI